MIDLNIIIVSWNVRDKLRNNLQKIFASHGDIKYRVFVVDNASADDSAAMVKNEFPQVELIANDKNLGFAKANNQAIKMVLETESSPYILLLNPDMEVKSDTLEKMLDWMKKNPQAGVAGCHLLAEDGSTVRSVRRFPRLSDQLAIVLKLPHFFPKILDDYLWVDFDYNQASRVDSIRGGFFMLNTSLLKNKLFLDELYFIWFEEVDFCLDLYTNSSNIEVWYTPAAICQDSVGQSFKQLPRGTSQKYFRDSQLKYFRKWKPYWQYLILKMAWPLGILIASLGEKVGLKSKAKT